MYPTLWIMLAYGYKYFYFLDRRVELGKWEEFRICLSRPEWGTQSIGSGDNLAFELLYLTAKELTWNSVWFAQCILLAECCSQNEKMLNIKTSKKIK